MLNGGLPGGSAVKNPPANAGDTGSVPDPGRSHMPRSAGSQHGESRPWQTSWGRGPDKTQRRDQASGVPPLGFSRASTPKTRVCLLYCIMPFTNSSDINRGLSPHHLFLEKVNLDLLDNKYLGRNKSVSIQKLLWWLSSLPDRFVQTLTAVHVIVCGLPTARGTGSLKHPRNVGASEESKSLEQDWLRVSLLSQYLLPSFRIFYLLI